MINILKRKCL